jgi:hypothetical protein
MSIIKKITTLIFSLLFLVLFYQSALAKNCCSESITSVGSNGSFSMTYSCEDGDDMTQEKCDKLSGSNGPSVGANVSTSFMANAICADKDDKKVCQPEDQAKEEIKPRLAPLNFIFNIPLPGLPSRFEINNESLPNYIYWLFKFVVAVAGLLSLFMIAVGAVMWLFAGGNSGQISQAKNYITSAIIGLLLALFSYSILYIINPQLLTNKMPAIKPVGFSDLEEVSNADYKKFTGIGKKNKAELIALAKQLASKYNFDYCAVYAILATESSGRVAAIGFDENVRSGGVGARKKFVNDNSCLLSHNKTKASGNCSVEGSARNDDSCLVHFSNSENCPKGQNYYQSTFSNCPREDLCLDWQYSRGIGMFQTTSGWYSCKNGNGRCLKINGREVTAKEFLKPELQYEWFGNFWKGKCPAGRSLSGEGGCWHRYVGAWNEAAQKKDMAYNDCKKGN